MSSFEQVRRAGDDRPWIAALLALAFGFWIFFPKGFIADDSYFYVVAARHLALDGHQSFSGLYPTNGVHPLWFYALSAYSWLVSLLGPDLLQHDVYAIPLAAAGLIGGALLFRQTARLLGLDPLLVVLPQLAFLTILAVLYSEAHIYFFALALLTRLAAGEVYRRRFGHLHLGLAAGLLFLSRLDLVFFLMAFYVWYLHLDRRLGRVIVSGLVLSAIAGAYMLSNMIFFGGATPISGWLKSTFPTPTYHGVRYFGGLNWVLSEYNIVFGILPVIFALLVVAVWRKEIKGPLTLLYVYIAGSSLHFIYTAFFTKGFASWYWYYVVNVVAGALAFAFLAQKLPWPRRIRTATAAFIILAGAAYLFADKRDYQMYPRQTLAIDFFKSHDVHHQTVLVTEWPGAVAFYSDNHIIAADMLTGNRFLYQKMIASGNALQYLADLAAQQGQPLQWVIYNNGAWIEPSPDRKTISYNAPKLWPKKEKIGELFVGEPFLLEEDPLFIVWKTRR